MSDLSEDDSSDDSSKEFLVNPGKLNLNSSFFKTPRTRVTQRKSEHEDSSDDDGFHDVTEQSSVELFSQVLQNLESTEKNSLADDSGKQESSFAGSQTGDHTLTTSTDEITELLLRGEAASSSFSKDSEEAEKVDNQAPVEYSIPKEGVKITLPGTEILFNRRKRKDAPDPLAILRKHFRETQLLVCKVSLLCWLSHGFHLNRLINEPEIMSVSLSLLASSNYPKSRIDLPYLEKLTKWFSGFFKKESIISSIGTSKEKLLKCAQDKKFSDYSELVLLFIALLRALGFNSRLVVSLCPPRRKLPENLMSKTEKQGEDTKTKKKSNDKSKKNESKESQSISQKVAVLNSLEARKAANTEAKKRAAEMLKGKSKDKPSTSKISKNEEMEESKKKDDDPSVSGLSRLRSRRVATSKETSKTSVKKEEDESIQEPKRVTRSNKRTGVTNKKEDDTVSKYYKEEEGNTKTEAVAHRKTRQNNSRSKTSAKEDDTVSKYYKEEEGKTKTEVQRKTRQNNSKSKTSAKEDDSVSKYYKREETDSDEETAPLKKPRRDKTTTKSTSKTVKEAARDSEEEFEDKKPQTRKLRAVATAKKVHQYMSEDSDSDEEFKPEPRKAPRRGKSTEEKNKSKESRKLVSSDSEENDDENFKNKENLWAEVYLESEESWISVCVPEAKVHCVTELYKRAKKPVLYVIAWNSQGEVKDVTRRYCPQWLTVTRKKRINEEWWSEALQPWKEKNTAISRAEDELLLQKELAQPLPTTVSECKGHPLYVLIRHLLKFEALYPPECVPLGRIRTGEAIYSRHCVHTLRSRETWIKQARVVKPNQEPYKIVKSLPKYDKLSGTKIKDMPLELFGEWQTTEYIPPEAKDGIVPRNEYGNVDLFKQSMIPKGTVHINLPALNRVARKLNIDCAPAVVGFNFGAMGAVPAFEGFIVCEEFEDTLREAWEAEQIEAIKRAKEKREKRVYGNWKKLIHGLFIREKLAAKYEFTEQEKAAGKRAKHKTGDTKKSKVS